MPDGEQWAYELKWDGVRAVVAVAGDRYARPPATTATSPPATPNSINCPTRSPGDGCCSMGNW